VSVANVLFSLKKNFKNMSNNIKTIFPFNKSKAHKIMESSFNKSLHLFLGSVWENYNVTIKELNENGITIKPENEPKFIRDYYLQFIAHRFVKMIEGIANPDNDMLLRVDPTLLKASNEEMNDGKD